MPLLLLHRRYVRSCKVCGDTWTVTRRQAAGSPGRSPRPKRMTGGRAGVIGGAGATYDVGTSRERFDAAVEVWQGYRRCPHCGIDTFSQVPAGRRMSP